MRREEEGWTEVNEVREARRNKGKGEGGKKEGTEVRETRNTEEGRRKEREGIE